MTDVGLAELRAALVRLVIDQQPSEQLPDLAAKLLATSEVDSPSLRELAGLASDDVRQARELFLAALQELGVQIPGEHDSYLEQARFWAREMLAGSLSPYEASRHIWWRAWEPAGRPTELTAFVGLASQWEDDPEQRPLYERDMLAEARRILAS